MSSGETKLQLAVNQENPSLSKIEGILRDENVPVNNVDKCGYTALQDACIGGNYDIVALLLKHNADVNYVNVKQGTTALMDVCHGGFIELIEPLLQAGADVSVRDTHGWSASDYLQDKVKRVKNDCTQEQLSRAEKLFRDLKSKERPTSIIRQKKGALHGNVTDEGKEEDEVVFEDDLKPASFKGVRKPSKLSSQRTKPKTTELVPSHDFPVKKRISSLDFETVQKQKKPRLAQDFQNKILKASPEENIPVAMTIPTSAEASTTLPKKAEEQVNKDVNLVLVDIEGERLQVFLPKDATVEELANEAAKRYFDVYDKKPVLKLFDKNSAQLYFKDKVSMVLALANEAIFRAKVISWTATPIEESYAVFCQRMGSLSVDEIHQSLVASKTTGRVDLSQFGLADPTVLEPVLKALQCQPHVEELSLNCCRLGATPTVRLFADACLTFAQLEQMTVLDLSNNCLTSKHLSELSRVKLAVLRSLNLSFNNLEDRSSGSMDKILSNWPSLDQLRLRSCCLTQSFVIDLPGLGQVKDLDLSYNRLGVSGIVALVSKCNLSQQLDVSGCIRSSSLEDDERLMSSFSEWQKRAPSLIRVIARRNKVQSVVPASLRDVVVF